jgi:peptide deformylase
MTILDLVLVPNPILRQTCETVTSFDSVLHVLLDDMYETMIHHNGVGLAAPQIGSTQSITVIDISGEYIQKPTINSTECSPEDIHFKNNRLELINPTIELGSQKASSDEGCLSIPEYRDTIRRSYSITVNAHDRLGQPFSFEAEDFLAFVVQHEVDHLHGTLFTDHLSRLKKSLFRKWCAKHIGENIF